MESRMMYLEIIIENLLNFLKSKKNFSPEIVLDIGCAEGIFPYLFNRKYNIKCFGIDLTIDKNKIISNKYFVRADARALPFKNKTFDLITAIEVLEHIEKGEIDTVIGEISRVIKSSGFVFITTPTPLEQLIRSMLGKACKDHKTIQSKNFWIKKFKSYGFYILEDFEAVYCQSVSTLVENITEKACLELKIGKLLNKFNLIIPFLRFWKNVMLFEKID